MTEPCAPINEGIYKKKKPLIFRDFLVDLEGVEPSSKQGSHMLSTCLSLPSVFVHKQDQSHPLIP